MSILANKKIKDDHSDQVSPLTEERALALFNGL